MHDMLLLVSFYVFALIAVVSAFFVITQNNPVRCVLFLVLTFVAMSVLWLLQEAEFLALILVLVYVGAVMTLFLFVVMMLNIDTASIKGHFIRSIPIGVMVVALLTALLIKATPEGTFIPTAAHATQSTLSNTEQLGMVLYTDYVYAFELAAVILLVAIIASITLVHRVLRSSKKQNIGAQLRATPAERLKIIPMKAEK